MLIGTKQQQQQQQQQHTHTHTHTHIYIYIPHTQQCIYMHCCVFGGIYMYIYQHICLYLCTNVCMKILWYVENLNIAFKIECMVLRTF